MADKILLKNVLSSPLADAAVSEQAQLSSNKKLTKLASEDGDSLSVKSNAIVHTTMLEALVVLHVVMKVVQTFEDTESLIQNVYYCK